MVVAGAKANAQDTAAAAPKILLRLRLLLQSERRKINMQCRPSGGS